jgi:hypothetical protein
MDGRILLRHTTIKKNDINVWLVYAISMNRETQIPKSYLYVAVFIGKVDNSRTQMLVQLALVNVLDEFVD